MANAKLHVICGNCGCSDEWMLHIDRCGKDVSQTFPEFIDAAYMKCGNCGTLHDLSDNAKITKSEHTMGMP